jgi:hypothetical protein
MFLFSGFCIIRSEKTLKSLNPKMNVIASGLGNKCSFPNPALLLWCRMPFDLSPRRTIIALHKGPQPPTIYMANNTTMDASASLHPEDKIILSPSGPLDTAET